MNTATSVMTATHGLIDDAMKNPPENFRFSIFDFRFGRAVLRIARCFVVSESCSCLPRREENGFFDGINRIYGMGFAGFYLAVILSILLIPSKKSCPALYCGGMFVGADFDVL